jgi:eukaryotic-like serine/threonine-protein kinase
MKQMPQNFQLNHLWRVVGTIGDEPGMSEVFEVVRDGVHAVIKQIEKLPGAERELLVSDLGECRNIVPFDEVVETDNQIMIRMPRAEKSLNQHLEAAGGPLSETEIITVLSHIATALEDLGRVVVHRDIKPQNILLLDGKWCLADFGIARYIEAATEGPTRTRKRFGSDHWTAPERWEGRRATIKSDIYSLGVVAYQMATGRLPFTGPDLYEQHRSERPEPPSGISPLTHALISEMLAKSPEARPTPMQVLRRVAVAGKPVMYPNIARLYELGKQRAEQMSKEDASAAEALLKKEQRDLFEESARAILREALDPLMDFFHALPGIETGSGYTIDGLPGVYFALGEAKVWVTEAIPPDWTLTTIHVKPRKLDLPFDVVLSATVKVVMPSHEQPEWAGRSHSLWYCDAQTEGEYHWFETAFFNRKRPRGLYNVRDRVLLPYDHRPWDYSVQYALNPSRSHTGANFERVARPFTALIGRAVDNFTNRWISWFADAAEGRLVVPKSLPEGRTAGTWRRAVSAAQ